VAVAALPGWSDEGIVECDLVRLHAAIKAGNDRQAADWRQRARIAGIDVPEPEDETEPKTDEEFNAQFRRSLARFKRPTPDS
jgi:hypothetical protein